MELPFYHVTMISPLPPEKPPPPEPEPLERGDAADAPDEGIAAPRLAGLLGLAVSRHAAELHLQAVPLPLGADAADRQRPVDALPVGQELGADRLLDFDDAVRPDAGFARNRSSRQSSCAEATVARNGIAIPAKAGARKKPALDFF